MRNTNSQFAQVPRAEIKRSSFKRNHTHKDTFNAGKLVPFYLEKIVLPGDTHKVRTNISIRMSTPIHPVMDNCYLDTYFFAVPYRLIWDEFEEFMGENKDGPWLTDKKSVTEPYLEYKFGQTTPSSLTWPDSRAIGSVYDKMGYPIVLGAQNASYQSSVLPFRGYAKIWNDWFRCEQTDYPCVIHTDSIAREGRASFHDTDSYITSAEFGGALCPVSKFHDYFTSALPSPQYGYDVFLPLNGEAPVVTSLTEHENKPFGVVFKTISGENPGAYTLAVGSDNKLRTTTSSLGSSGNQQVIPTNLVTDLSLATSASINQLREALALQSFFERSARFGNRYTELIRGHFGVSSPDSRLQRSEYLGGKRICLNMQSVIQQSATNEVSPQGNASGYSWTIDSSDSFTYSSTEHCMIIGVCCIRTSQSYQYGLPRDLSTLNMIDYYFPTFDSIGEQAILNKEIFVSGNIYQDNEVFGYQEAWAEYRYKPSYITGDFRSISPQTLDSWHYAEKYNSMPTLSSEFMHQDASVIDRTLAVSSDLSPQFIMDCYFEQTSVRPMSIRSIPGLRSFL